MEREEEKRYYVNFYDMFDGWGVFGFFTERLFNNLQYAIILCDRLNDELEERNRECGEHYGVIDGVTKKEVYCGLYEKYKIGSREHSSEFGIPKVVKQDENIDKLKSDNKLDSDGSDGKLHSDDKYQEVAEEIVYMMKDDLSNSSDVDIGQIANVLRRRFNINDEAVGKILLSEITLFNIYSGNTITVPIFGLLAVKNLDNKLISGKCYPNFDINNKYAGYTEDNIFHKINWSTEFVNSVKRDPLLVVACIIAGFSVGYTILNVG